MQDIASALSTVTAAMTCPLAGCWSILESMNRPRWHWPLIMAALVLILVSSMRSSDWGWLGSTALPFGAAYFAIWFARRHGYEWRRNRGVGLMMIAVMLAALLVGSFVTASFELSVFVASSCGAVTLLAVGLRRSS